MSITDELRESVKQTCWAMTSKAKWFAIADRIDIEHKKAVDIAFTNGRTEGIADGCAYYDTEHTECMLSEEHGWIRLPKDADGEYIHIGDVMYDSNESPSEKFNVAIMELNKWGWSLIDSYGERNEPSQCFHHHEPTVEDVLDEFASAYDRIGGEDEEHQKYLDLIAEYAAKLQLRGDGE